MSFPKIVFILSLLLFTAIGITFFCKKSTKEKKQQPIVQEVVILPKKEALPPPLADEPKEVDLVDKLFTTDASRLPIVETLTYSCRVPWLKGRPAWIADYAAHYETTRHFIARSLNRKPDYFTQKIGPGDRFNVLKKDVHFHLIIDLSKCKMWFYAYDENSHYLLKTYCVGVGRKDPSKASGCLTPTGKYRLGSKVAIYKRGTTGFFQDQKIEMISIFGTRWIPFEEEVENCSERAKGYGLHGAPWVLDEKGNLFESREKIGQYDSDGCIRLRSEDIEELFAIVISKPTVVEVVKDLSSATFPARE